MTGMRSIALAGVFAVAGLPAHADMVSYFLDQSNVESAFPDLGATYLRVDITDNYDASGDVRFDVTILDPRLLTGNSGIMRFGFNLAAGATPITAVNILRPANWGIATDANVDGFGNFELVTDTTAPNRVSPTLTFFISGIAGDNRFSYVELATNSDDTIPLQGSHYFAAQVVAFNAVNGITSGFFGGQTPAVVPLPASVWLLVSGLGLLARVRNRRAVG